MVRGVTEGALQHTRVLQSFFIKGRAVVCNQSEAKHLTSVPQYTVTCNLSTIFGNTGCIFSVDMHLWVAITSCFEGVIYAPPRNFESISVQECGCDPVNVPGMTKCLLLSVNMNVFCFFYSSTVWQWTEYRSIVDKTKHLRTSSWVLENTDQKCSPFSDI